MTWSYSRIGCYDDCKYRWFLKYIRDYKETDQFYSSYGTFMHKLIEGFYKGELTKDEMLEEFLTGFSQNVRGLRPKQETVSKYIKLGADYLRSFQPFPYKMIAVEQFSDFTINGHRFVGYIDFLGCDSEGGLHIIDNKSRDLKPRSNRKTPTVKDKELDSMLKQLYLYAEAVRQEYGRFPKTLCFNCFKAGVFIEEPFDEGAYNQAIAWATERISEIEKAEDFPPNLDYFGCKYICGVSDYCDYYQLWKG